MAGRNICFEGKRRQKTVLRLFECVVSRRHDLTKTFSMTTTPLFKRIKIKFSKVATEKEMPVEEVKMEPITAPRPKLKEEEIQHKALEIFQYLLEEFYPTEWEPSHIARAAEDESIPRQQKPSVDEDMAADDEQDLKLPDLESIDLPMIDLEALDDLDLELEEQVVEDNVPAYLLYETPILPTFIPDPFPYTMIPYQKDEVKEPFQASTNNTTTPPPPPLVQKVPRERRERAPDDDDVIHSCHECGKVFLKRRYLDRHLEIHDRKNSNAPPEFICDLCGKAFIFKHRLDKHKKIHGEKMFSCEICGKSVATSHGIIPF
jgi:hypothetical protein